MLDPQKQHELDALIHKLVDGEIGPFEFQRLNDLLLHDKDAQRYYVHHADLVNAIRWQSIGEATQQSIAALKAVRDAAPKPTREAIPERPAPRRFALRFPTIDVRYAAAAAIVLAVTLVGMLIASRMRTADRIASTDDLVIPVPPAPPEPEVALVPKVEQRAGTVQVREQGHDAAADARDVEVAAAIQPGQTIETRGSESTTVLAYDDNTSIVLGNDTTFTIEKAAQKQLALEAGSLAANVSPQPASKPMRIVTPHAEIQVVGTRFSVETERDHTKLSVTEGKVLIRLIQQEDGRWTEVPAGRYAIAQPATQKVVVNNIPDLPKTWSEDFENGLPAGWRLGKLVKESCCKGTKYSARAKQVQDVFQIRTPTKRSEGEGLFQIHPDTHVHLILKVKGHAVVSLFMSTRSDGPVTQYGSFVFPELDKIIKKNTWYQVSIPISAFQPMRGTQGDFPHPDDVPFEMSLNNFKHDIGLTLDKIWVTRGGPGFVLPNEIK